MFWLYFKQLTINPQVIYKKLYIKKKFKVKIKVQVKQGTPIKNLHS